MNADINYDEKGNATHYNDRVNLIYFFENIWGTQNTIIHFEMSIMKYRYRLGKKVGESVEKDLLKIRWYERALIFLRNKIAEGQGIEGLGNGDMELPKAISEL